MFPDGPVGGTGEMSSQCFLIVPCKQMEDGFEGIGTPTLANKKGRKAFSLATSQKLMFYCSFVAVLK